MPTIDIIIRNKTAKKTYKETGITEVCIKGVSLPTDAGFDVGAHIIVEGIAK